MDKQIILDLVQQYHHERFEKQAKPYQKGDRISYGGRFFDHHELVNLVDSALDFWLTTGPYAETMERRLAEFLQVKHCHLVNSGSSANLLAFMTLCSPLLKDRQIQRGDEVITVAAGFPTTIAPILQYGAVPVFVDIQIPQYNIDVQALEEALSPKTKAVILAHTLGNPFDLKTVKDFCDRHQLWLIEDNCDALGSTYECDGQTRFTGTVGDLGTSSFYPPHHMTMGEGGAVYTNHPLLNRIVLSLRDWGRDCFCPSGKDDTCKRRFTQQFGELPMGYDHKYVYSHLGYNLKLTDMQAAIGVAQLDKLPHIIQSRKANWQYLRQGLADCQPHLILPEAAPHSDPSWFGFLITVNPSSPVNRDVLVRHLESQNIQTRMLFAGNLIKHPCFDHIRGQESVYRCVGSLSQTDRLLNDTFWIGVYPGLSQDMLDEMIAQIRNLILP